MTTTVETLSLVDVAELFARSFELRVRNDERNTRHWVLKGSAPCWAADVARELHMGEMPNDWRYEQITLMADQFSEGLQDGLDADSACERISVEPDCYNSDLLEWLAFSGSRMAEAEELQPSDCPFELIRQAQAQALWNMAQQLQWQLEQITEELNSARQAPTA